MTKQIKTMIKETYSDARKANKLEVMLGCIDALNRVYNTDIHKKDIKHKNSKDNK